MSMLSDILNIDLTGCTNKIIAEYIWIGGPEMNIRSQAKTFPGPVNDLKKLSDWSYEDGGENVILRPKTIFKDPFRRGNNILVMCDAYTPLGEPIPTNPRHAVEKDPWYGIEQEYALLQKSISWPVGWWPLGAFPGPQGPYYGGIGAVRDIVDAHYKACLYAGINITGIKGKVRPGQWEFVVEPKLGISVSDELLVARYILERITEIAGVDVSFDPMPLPGDWNGVGARTNYSTKSMKEGGGYEVKGVGNFGMMHKEYISACGEGNERFLPNHHETANINTSRGIANHGASIHVGRDTEEEGSGHSKDQGLALIMDPCGVIAAPIPFGVKGTQRKRCRPDHSTGQENSSSAVARPRRKLKRPSLFTE